MLSLNNIEVIYNEVILVLKGLSVSVKEGQIAALLGTNGAGKSTTLKAMKLMKGALLKYIEDRINRSVVQYLFDMVFGVNQTHANILFFEFGIGNN